MLNKLRKCALVSLLLLVFSSLWVLKSAAESPALVRLKGAEKERVAKLIEGAKKEKKLVGYSSGWRPDVQAELFPAFRKEYGLSESDLELNIVSSRTGSIIPKVTEELRAKVYVTDIIKTPTIYWFNDLIARGEIMAYNSPEYRNFHSIATDPKMGYGNPPYFIPTTLPMYAIAYNPKFIRGEIEHWKDVLRPEYEGKINCGDVTQVDAYLDSYMYVRKAVGVGFFEELGKRKPFLHSAGTDAVNMCVSGEYPIILFAVAPVVFRANLKGADLKLVFPSEGYGIVAAPTVILTHAPHPNAAKLLLDFVHSQAGQQIEFDNGYSVARLGMKSKYPGFPKPIYELKGVLQMDWRKITNEDRMKAAEEFRRLVVDRN